VAASSPRELARTSPRLLGVRHISHAQQWKPYATNLHPPLASSSRRLATPGYLEDHLLRRPGPATMTHYKVRRAVRAWLPST
jgi:hypothetical protein